MDALSAKGLLIGALEAGGAPAFLQGSLDPDEEYPGLFWTFWLYDAPETAHYDNAATACEWSFWAYCYGTDPAEVAAETESGARRLKEAGFVLVGRAVDAPSDVKTHTGTMMDARLMDGYRWESEEK